jgi:tetratricopeptide (TPR) repeat protein
MHAFFNGFPPSHGNMDPSPQETLNPIFDFAANGQYHENRMEWKSAVHWYHRALACLPNLFGSDKKIRPLGIPGQKSISFMPQHASRIYAALGRTLMSLGRLKDSFLAYQAAAALDPENRPANRMLTRHPAIPYTETANAPVMAAGPGFGRTCDEIDLKDAVTLVMVTHCTRRLKKFEPLSPPSSKLVTATYGSLLRVFGEDIDACPKVMCYDINPNGSERDAQYTQSIETFSRENGFTLRRFRGEGLFNVLNQTVQCIDTPYIFFVEHDWMFRGEGIRLPAIIEMMENERNIHAIRLNKRDNSLNGQDFLMSVDSIQRRYPLMRTSSYSNNPSMIRTEKLKNEWLPICDKALRRVNDQLGGSAFGIEEILFRNYVRDIRAHGFRKAHKKWGMYIFGEVGDKPRITHLGE